VPDIKNCRILLIAKGAQVPARIYGASRRPPGGCEHDPPRIFGSPNGAFPMLNGHYLVTEIRGAWIALSPRRRSAGSRLRPQSENFTGPGPV